MVLRGNFIEDIRNVTLLENLCEFDLADNCLLEHSSLSPLSYLEALHWLNLEGNPLSYHPQHRSRTIKCLHINTNTVRFTLDRLVITKSEQKLVGTVHATHIGHQRLLASYNSVASDSTIVASERQRKVRNATIADSPTEVNVSPVSFDSLINSLDHLETRRQIKELREKYGESWLQQEAGSIVQDVLGLERTSLPVTSSPYEAEFLLHAAEIAKDKEKTEVISEQSNNTFATASESTVTDNSVYARDNDETSSDEEIDLGSGDESIYLATRRGEADPVFLVVTKYRLSERNCITSKEKVRWHIESLTSCELVKGDPDPDFVRLEFETLRKDKQLREYVLDNEETLRLISVLNNVIQNKPPEEKKVTIYQCMKCSKQFTEGQVIRKYDTPLECPACQSTLVIEQD